MSSTRPSGNNDGHAIHYPWWFGGSASCLAVCLTHPLDLIKVRMQASQSGPARLGAVGTTLAVVKNDGVGGLYKGLTASLARQVLYSTTRFAIYDYLKEQMTFNTSNMNVQKPSMLGLIGAASISGMIGGVVGNPADLANVRMQNDSNLPSNERRNYKNVFSAWKDMAKDPKTGRSGVVVFWKTSMTGVSANSVRAAIMTASQLAAYDAFKDLLVSPPRAIRSMIGVDRGFDANATSTHLLASTLAGLVATTLCSPVDVIKTQVMKAGRNDAQISITSLVRDNFRDHGIKWMFRGWLPSFTRLGPQTVATFIILEQQRKAYRYFISQ